MNHGCTETQRKELDGFSPQALCASVSLWFFFLGLAVQSQKRLADTGDPRNVVGTVFLLLVAALFIWPFAIPAIVDGVKSSNANEQLNADYQQKTIGEQVILPQTKFTGLVFAPVSTYRDTFSIVLIDKDSRDVIKFNVTVHQ